MNLEDLLKRKEYNYSSDMNLDSLKYSDENLYPYYLYVNLDNGDKSKLYNDIKSYTLDYSIYTNSNDKSTVYCGFQTMDDLNTFLSSLQNYSNINKYDLFDKRQSSEVYDNYKLLI